MPGCTQQYRAKCVPNKTNVLFYMLFICFNEAYPIRIVRLWNFSTVSYFRWEMRSHLWYALILVWKLG